MKKRRLPARELQIAQRLREVREALRLTQTEFAEQIGIARQRLASYEEGRVPIRYDLALRLCRQFIVSEKWLATGEGDTHSVMDLRHEPVVAKIPADWPFSKAYDEFLATQYEVIFQESGGVLRIQMSADEDYSFFENLFNGVIKGWIESLPKEEATTFCYLLLEHGRMLMIRRPFLTWSKLIQNRAEGSSGAPRLSGVQGPIPQEESVKNDLQYDSLKSNTDDVMTELEKLLARIRRVAVKPGAKAELARFLDVAPARVTEWLTEDSKRRKEPGGHYTLQLLKWVELQERKSK